MCYNIYVNSHEIPWEKRRWPQRLALVLAVVLTLTTAFHLIKPLLFRPIDNPEWGVSFSIFYARELGVDPQANLDALLDDMGIRNFRLMSPWSESEKIRGQYDFTDLDWQIAAVAQRGGHVSLAVGLRQPRWPECHAPEWARTTDDWQVKLYGYIAAVVERYHDNPAVTSWQLENEYKNSYFGECTQFGADPGRAMDEMEIIRERSDKPVYMSLSDQVGLPLNEPTPDGYGMSIYGRFFWHGLYLKYPDFEWWHRGRSALIKLTKDRDTFVHEFQLEPWGPEATIYLNEAEQDKTMNAAMIPERLDYARRLGMREIYLWGGEWWYWRLTNGDDSIWNAVRDGIKN